ncbi:hypothetical protein [Haloferula sp.]|uniref:hypothetical protein n=1 Tax=Haloferula sp. TaxID=2497595 RepID=UPI003C730C3B
MHAIRAGLPVVCFCLSQVSAMAGEPPAIIPATEPASNGDWCEWLSSKPGTLYKNSENPFIQEFGFGGRFHWNAAYLSGDDVNGYTFGESHTEFRRFRLNASAQIFEYFKLQAYVNMVRDTTNLVAAAPFGGGKVRWGYDNFDQAHITFDIKKAFNVDSLDGLSLMYGRLKNEITNEAWTSSKRLLTVERSAIANTVFFGGLPTGVTLNAEKNGWNIWASLYSTDALTPLGGNTEFIGGWNDGLAYRLGVGYVASEELSFQWDIIYNNADVTQGDDSLFRYKWVTSLSAVYDVGQWGLIGDFIYGDNGGVKNGVLNPSRGGDFWAIVVMPYYWFIDNKVQGVLRYQYQGSSEDEGIRVYSRYARADNGPVANRGINGGRGNAHHSIYGGVNYYLCGNNVKLQVGLEYECLNTPGVGTEGEYSALTSWFGFRTYF